MPEPAKLSYSDDSDEILAPSSNPSGDSLEYPLDDDILEQPTPTTGRVIGPTNLMDLVACPCCQQNVAEDIKTLNEPVVRRQRPNSQRSLVTATLEDEDEDDDASEADCYLPGVIAGGVEYFPYRILVEGWLHKKGTGKDVFGNKNWKARWGRLALARTRDSDMDVPLLLVYWFPSSTSTSTAILLDSTVVIAVDIDDPERWNAYRFEIRHASTRLNETIPVTRVFTAPRKARDAWVYAISQALLTYEKDKAKNRRRHRRRLSPERPSSEHFLTIETRPPMSPPTSPPPPLARTRTPPPNLPRPMRPKPPVQQQDSPALPKQPVATRSN